MSDPTTEPDAPHHPPGTPRERAAWLWGFWRHHKAMAVAIICLTAVDAVVMMLPPWVVATLIATLQSGATNQQIVALVAALAWLEFAHFTLYILLQTARSYMNVTLEWTFRQHAYEHLVYHSPRFLGRFRSGDLVTRLTDDVGQKLCWFSCSGIFRTLEAGSKVLVGLCLMIALSPKLTLMTVLPLPLIILLFAYTRRAMARRFDARQKAISRQSDLVESALSGLRLVKAYRHAPRMLEDFAGRVDTRREAEIHAVKGEVLIGALYGQTWQVATVCCLMAGGWMVASGQLGLAVVVGMMLYVQRLVWPMFDFGQFLVAALRAAVSIDRLRELELEPPEIREPATPRPLPDPEGRLRFEGVGLTLTGRDVLRDVGFEVPAGARVAVVGPVGAGKSALLRLVPRLLDPDAGRLLLDDVPLQQLRLDDLRRAVGYVPQDPLLFSGTIEDNLRAGRAWVTEADLDWACRVARLETDLAAMPDGRQTIVGARGITLSGGQKQRTSLARALVGRPKVIVLDDCTAALDASTEAELWGELASALPGTTVLMSTHRTATLETASRVAVLDGGSLVQLGTHETLVDEPGPYAELYRRRQLEERVGAAPGSSERRRIPQ